MRVPELRLGPIVDASRDAPSYALPDVLARELPRLGMRDPRAYVIDLEQVLLVPAPRTGEADLEALPVEGTLAGRSYTTTEVVAGHAADGVRAWVPILDGVARIGVLAVTVDEYDDEVRARLMQLGGWLALLLVTHDAYTDYFKVLRHRRPVSLAAQVQWQLVPPLTAKSPWVTVAGNLGPAYQIGGDAFDYAMNDGVQHVAIFDSMGHDLGASAVTSIALGAYRYSREQGHALTDTYCEIDRAVAEVFGHERFVTAQLAQLDSATGTLRWCNAGHPLPLLVRDARVVGRLQCPPAPPLGMWREHSAAVEPHVAEVTLEVGDRVLFVTDGLIEARAADGTPFGESRVEDLLRRALLDGFPAAETVRRLAHAVMAYQPGPPRDDVTMVLVHFERKRRTGTGQSD